MGIEFPVAVDSNFAIWNAFGNQYWPAMYFIDAKGRIRHNQFGEGGYDQSELALQQLLTETNIFAAFDSTLTVVIPSGFEIPANANNLRSPETYLGYDRSESFASPGGAKKNRSQMYAAPDQLKLNQWALSGDWTVEREGIKLNQPNGKLFFRFHARDLHLVMKSIDLDRPINCQIRLAGQAPGLSHGIDVGSDGQGTVIRPRLYQLLRRTNPLTDQTFEIQFFGASVEAYGLTFG